MAFVASRGEFRVNSQTGGDQLRPEVATLANGGFIVVWDDASGTFGDSSGRSIKAQLYDASGAAVGGEFLVNTQTTGDQVGPEVTGLSDGRFVVTWTDASGISDGSLSSVQAQMFDAAGFRIGTEFVVNSQTSSSQSASDIAPWEGDRFVTPGPMPSAMKSWHDVTTRAAPGSPILSSPTRPSISRAPRGSQPWRRHQGEEQREVRFRVPCQHEYEWIAAVP